MYILFNSLKYQNISNRDIIESLRHFSSKKMRDLDYAPNYITRGTKKHFFAREDKDNFNLTRIRRNDIEKLFPKFVGHINKQQPHLKVKYRLSRYSLLILLVLVALSSYYIYKLIYKGDFLGYTNTTILSATFLFILFFFLELNLTNQAIKTAINRYVNDEIKYAV